MIKILSAVFLICFVSINAHAGWVIGTVNQIRYYSENSVIINVTTASDGVQEVSFSPNLTADEQKFMLASLLTAYAGGRTVQLFDSASGLLAIKLDE